MLSEADRLMGDWRISGELSNSDICFVFKHVEKEK